jgi:peptidoglycan/LPS O-acetylase OafA/YrhL
MDPKQEITDLTICRALFAAWVFAYHVDLYVNFAAWLGPLKGIIRHGYLGVDGFFMLSGFILAQVHPELSSKASVTPLYTRADRFQPKAALIFLGKRLARIYPVHLATLLLFGAVLLTGLADDMPPRDPAHFGGGALVQNIFLVQGWGLAGQGAWNYPSWSVSTEWAGYLAFPLLWYVISYFEWYVSLQFVIAGFCALGLIVTRNHGNLNLTFAEGLFRFFPEFIMGMSMVRFVAKVADNGGARRAFLLGGLGGILLGAVLGFDLMSVTGIWFVLFALVMQADAHLPAILPVRYLRRLGLISYSFYMSFALAELLITQWFRREGWAPASHGFIFAASMLAVTSVVAVLLHVIIEVPCRRRIDSWLAPPASP